MYTVTINDANTALDAGYWAKINIRHQWDIDASPFVSPSYTFKFVDKIDASWFALKWL